MNKIRLGQNNLNVRVIVFLLLSLLTATLLKFESVYAFPEELPVSYPAINSSIVEKKNRLKRVNEQYIIKFRESSTEKEKEDFLTGNGLPAGSKGKKITTVKRKIENYNKNIVEIIEEDGIIETESINTSDPLYKEQWYLEAVGFEKAFGLSNVSEKIVAVIDSGVCFEHPDLQGKILTGWNFVNDNSDVTDTIGHGCFMSGIIGANINNQEGIAGAGVNVKILPLKVIGENGLGNYSDLIEAIDYAAEQNVAIINISLGGLSDSEILHQVIQEVTNKGIKVVASAGNTANNEIMYPAKYSEVVSVGSVENDYTVSNFSSNSQEIKLWAYGSNILTTDKSGDYVKTSGTSIAAAEVSAFIANGGEYGDKSIISYVRKGIKPVFKDNIMQITENLTKLMFRYPENLNSTDFTNTNANKDTQINWEKNISVAQSEALIFTIWSRKNVVESEKLLKVLKFRENCEKNDDMCLSDLSQQNAFSSSVSYFIKDGTNVIRIKYIYNKFIGYSNFKSILKTVSINNKNVNSKKFIDFLERKVTIGVKIHPQVQSCGGITDPNTNDFPCCSSADGQNDANCTWYAMYKRPDLRGKVTGNAGSWYQEAIDHNVSVSSTPEPGAIVVWTGHVAFVESVDYNSRTMTWSEQNCYKPSNPYNASVSGPFSSTYAGALLGFILPSNSNICNGTNQIMSNWNQSTTVTCTPTGSLTILPESILKGTGNSTIFIKPN